MSGDDLQTLGDVAELVRREFEFRRRRNRAERRRFGAAARAEAEASGDVLFVTDRHFRVKEVGARACEVWGAAPEDLVGRRLDQLLSPAGASAMAAQFTQVAHLRRRGDFQSTLRQDDGTERTIYWSVVWSEADSAFYAITRDRPPADRSEKASNKRILVVDDYREIALLVRTGLNAAGFSNVHVASGPLKALEMAAGQHYDLVISDLRMQPINGVELFAKFRGKAGSEHVPFLIISGYANVEVIERMKALGVSGFIAKPFTIADVVRHVQRTLLLPEESLRRHLI